MRQETPKADKPSLPAHLYRQEPAMVALCFAYGFAMYLGFGYLGYRVAVTDWSLLAKIPAVLAAAMLAGTGLHQLGWLAHEGIHLLLARNKVVSMVLGCFAGSVLLFPTIGFGLSHWPHHRFTNQAGDPDTLLQARHQTFWRRFLLARPAANREYFLETIALVLGRPREARYRLPFREATLRRLGLVNLVFVGLWLATYVAVGLVAPAYVLFGFVIPYAMLSPVSGLRIYVEHGGTEAEPFRDSRSYISPLYTLLFFGNNYHLEHHLYPSVPCYKLPAVHRLLAAQGYHERFHSPVERGVLAPLRYTATAHRYPDAGYREAERSAEPASAPAS